MATMYFQTLPPGDRLQPPNSQLLMRWAPDTYTERGTSRRERSFSV